MSISKNSQNLSLDTKRHSFAHLMAASVQIYFRELARAEFSKNQKLGLSEVSSAQDSHVQFGVGPVIENGCYYDFILPRPLVPGDLGKIEKNICRLLKQDLAFERQEVSLEEAIEIFRQSAQPLKVELLENLRDKGTTSLSEEEKADLEGDSEKQKRQPEGESNLNLPVITLYRLVNQKSGEVIFEDLCKGPHVEELKEFSSLGFVLDKFSASYWRGDQTRDIRMQRIYALVFETEAEVKEFQTQREEAKKRDHRVLNDTQKYYTISDLVGAGLPLFQPNGMIIRQNIQDYLWQLHKDKGYKRVWTPHIAKEELYVASGHAAKFGDELFRVTGKTDKFFMKPMNCPHHMQLFADNQFSYRDIPIRYFEHATVYRDEKPGQLSGFTRVRSITQDDGHLFCRVSQIKQEVSTIVGIIREFYDTIGMEASWVSLSVRDMNNLEQYLGENDVWELAEKSLEEAAQANNLNYKRVGGEAAFYGPKLDFMFKDCLGREWQLATIQCDFNLPNRFDLSFTNEQGEKERPVVIHRAISGAVERFMGVLIDNFAGRFPFWLAPLQVKILTVNNQPEVLEYVEKIKQILGQIVLMKPLKYNEVRFEIDDRNESLGKKIREGEMQKIPALLIVGPKDIPENQVSVRTQNGEEKVGLERLVEFLEGIE